MSILRGAILPAVLLSLCAAADQLQPILAKIDEAAAAFKGLTADMKRIHHTAVINEDQEDIGTLTVRRPKPKDLQVLFDIKSPDQQLLYYSGRKAERFNPKTNIVEEYDLDKKYSAVVNRYMLLGFGSSSKDLQEAYTIAYGGPETVGGHKTTRIILTPKQPDTALHLVKADLWVSDASGIAVQQKLNYAGGDYDLVTYSNIKLNPNIPESAVKPKLPKDVKRENPLK